MLGTFELLVDGTPRPPRRWFGRKPLLLVKALALQPHHRIHCDELQELLWPGASPRAARNTLYKTLHLARRGLEPGLSPREPSRFLRLDGERLMLGPDAATRVDVDEFERLAGEGLAGADTLALERARALYRGDLLIDDPYESWFLGRRTALKLLFRDVLFSLATAYRERGACETAVERIRQHLAAEPWDEDAHRLLMRLYLDLGYPTRAERQYEVCRDAMRAGLDAEPGESTRRLVDLARGVRPAPPLETRPPAAADPATPPSAPAENPGGTRFVGRRREVGEILDLLATRRLVTLTGVGGIGKTRLAAEVARLSGRPVISVDFGDLTTPGQVPSTVARAFGLPEVRAAEATRAVGEALARHSGLVVLNECEHVLGACAELLVALCGDDGGESCFLVTSRQALGLSFEAVWTVGPLSLPAAGYEPTPTVVLAADAVELFADRARQAAPQFRVTAKNASLVSEICRVLEGIPLAIELAAAVVRTTPLRAVLATLRQKQALRRGSLDRPERHATMAATLDWSYVLLSEAERLVFRRLSVLVDGWSAGAAESVCAGGGVTTDEVEALVARLVDKSLVTLDAAGTPQRHRMLDVVRRYAAAKLAAVGEAPDAVERHSEFYLGLAERAERALFGVDSHEWAATLEAEYANIRASLGHLSEVGAPDERLARLCVALGPFWALCGRTREGGEWVLRALGAGADTHAPSGAWLLVRAGQLLCLTGDLEEAARYCALGHDTLRTLGDARGASRALSALAAVEIRRGCATRAEALLAEALVCARDAESAVDVALVLLELGIAVTARGALDEARDRYAECRVVARSAGALGLAAVAESNLGSIACARGDYERAEGLYLATLPWFREAGDRVNTALSLANIAATHSARSDFETAERLLAEALAISDEADDACVRAELFRRKGEMCLYQGQTDSAREHFATSAHVATSHGLALSKANADVGLAHVACAAADPDRALALAAGAVRFHFEHNDDDALARALDALACAEAPRDPQRALFIAASAVRLRARSGVVLAPPAAALIERCLAGAARVRRGGGRDVEPAGDGASSLDALMDDYT